MLVLHLTVWGVLIYKLIHYLLNTTTRTIKKLLPCLWMVPFCIQTGAVRHTILKSVAELTPILIYLYYYSGRGDDSGDY